MKEAMACLKKFTGHTWLTVFGTGGRGKSSGGLGYELHKRSQLPKSITEGLPPDAQVFSVRAKDDFRIYGYRDGAVGQIVWFDPTHDILPEGKNVRD